MTLPDFIIVGAQKAGTTSLYKYLKMHPDVYMPEDKEPGFFVKAFPDTDRFSDLYRPVNNEKVVPLDALKDGCFSLDDYKKLFANATKRMVVGEASTPYLPSKNAAARIKELLPNAKIVVMLRDPIRRAYSAYTYNYSRGTEPAKTFSEALSQELSGGRDKWLYGWRYLYAGRYSEHLSRYFEYFPLEQIKIVRFEDFKDNPQIVYQQVCDFLGLSSQVIHGAEPENVTTYHSNIFLRYARRIFTTDNKLKSVVKIWLPKRVRKAWANKSLKFIDKGGSRPPKLSDEDLNVLKKYYLPLNSELEKLTGLSFSKWIR
jgi:hypothetical protein